MTYPLPTDTAHVRLDTRQYRLLQWDLGEGVPRATFKVGAVFFLPWLLVCHLLGVPFLHLLAVWIGPPTLATYRAMSRDDSGRLRLQAWADRVAWWARRHRPIVNGDTASSATPRPLRTTVAFLVTDHPFYDNAMTGVPDGVRDDFTDPTEEAPRAQQVA